jgi:hypothetical protein
LAWKSADCTFHYQILFLAALGGLIQMKQPELVQISVSSSAERSLVVPAHRITLPRRAHELEILRKQLDIDLAAANARIRFENLYSPHAVAISDPMLVRLEKLHMILARAVTDVVDRWFSDQEARLWERMPLEREEEELLKWVAESGIIPKYEGRAGFARTDVLFGRSMDGLDDAAPFICEINGRLPLNGMLVAWENASGLAQLGAEEGGVEPLNTREVSEDPPFSVTP